jgi:hypothetical protein
LKLHAHLKMESSELADSEPSAQQDGVAASDSPASTDGTQEPRSGESSEHEAHNFPRTGSIMEVELEFDYIEHLLEEKLHRILEKLWEQRRVERSLVTAATARLFAAQTLRRVKLEIRDAHGSLLGSTSYVDYDKQSNKVQFRRQKVKFFVHIADKPTARDLIRVNVIGRTTPLKRYSSYVLPIPPALAKQAAASEHATLEHQSLAVREQYFASLPVDESAALSPVPFPSKLLLEHSKRKPTSSAVHQDATRGASTVDTEDEPEALPNTQNSTEASPPTDAAVASSHHSLHSTRIHLGHCSLELHRLWAHQGNAVYHALHAAGRHARLLLRRQVHLLPFCSLSLAARLPTFPHGSYSIRIHVHDVSIFQSGPKAFTSMNPVVHVYALGDTQHTQVCRWSFTAIFDRMLFFSKTLGQEQIRDEVITLAVWNWNFWRPSQLIGSYSFDFLALWNQKDHCFRERWLPLTNTTGNEDDLVGYIRISAVVYGPGIMPVAEHSTHAARTTAAAPRLLKNLVIQRPSLLIERWRLYIAILGIELAPSTPEAALNASEASHTPAGTNEKSSKLTRHRASQARLLSRRSEAGESNGKQVYCEIVFAGREKKAVIASEVVRVGFGKETSLSMGFCLPISLTNHEEANFEDILLRLRESPSSRLIADVHLPLSGLLQRGCTASIQYRDQTQLSLTADTEMHHHRTSAASSHLGHRTHGESTTKLERLFRIVHWLEQLVHSHLLHQHKQHGHIRERRVFEMRPHYIHLNASPTKYVGRILLAARMWPHSPHCKAIPLWYQRLNWAELFTASQRAPHRLQYTLYVRLQRITELPLPDSSLVRVYLKIGDRLIAQTDLAPVHHHSAVTGALLPVPPVQSVTNQKTQAMKLEVEQDLRNIPDLFLQVFYRTGHDAPERYFSLLRLPASLLHALPDDGLCRSWLMDRPVTETEGTDVSVAGTACLYICLRHQGDAHAPTKVIREPSRSRHSGTTEVSSMGPVDGHNISADTYWVECNILRCRNLPAADPTGFSDPFLVVRFGAARAFGTRLCHQTCDPSFQERLLVGPVQLSRFEALPPVSVKVFDWDDDPAAFDPRKLDKAEYLCRAEVDLTALDASEPTWFDMFITNPLIVHGGMLASFRLLNSSLASPSALETRVLRDPHIHLRAHVDTPTQALTSGNNPQSPEQRDGDMAVQRPPLTITPKPADLQSQPSRGPAASYWMLVGLVSIHHLGLRCFGLDPSRDSLSLRMFLNFRDGMQRSEPIHLSAGSSGSLGADQNHIGDVVILRLPPDIGDLSSLHIILESRDGERFYASANITPEEFAKKHLLIGGLQQYGLEYLEQRVLMRRAKRQHGPLAGMQEALETASNGAPQRSGFDLSSFRRQLKQVWQHDVRASGLALWAALVNYLVEIAPEIALRFGLEEMEFPSSRLTPWLLRFFRLLHHRGLVTALEHYERSVIGGRSKGPERPDHAVSDKSDAHGVHSVSDELERSLEPHAQFSEALLRHGLVRRKRRRVNLTATGERGMLTGIKKMRLPQIRPSFRAEPSRKPRHAPSTIHPEAAALEQTAPAPCSVLAAETPNSPATEDAEVVAEERSLSGAQAGPTAGTVTRRSSSTAVCAAVSPVRRRLRSGSGHERRGARPLRRGRVSGRATASMLYRRDETERRLSLLHHESRRYNDPVPVGKLALDWRIVRTGYAAVAADTNVVTALQRVEDVSDLEAYAAAFREQMRRRYVERNDVVVRLHVYHARGLRVPSGDPNIYLKVELNGGEKTLSTKRSPVRHSLNPDIFQSFEITNVRLPGSRLTIRVKHFAGPDFEVPNAAALVPRYATWTFGPFVHRAMSRDVRVDLVRAGIGRALLLGETEIDLDQRWYTDLPPLSRLESPMETRRLFVPDRVIPRGELTLRLELLSAEEAANRPFRPLEPLDPHQYELRLVIWRVIGCKLERVSEPVHGGDVDGAADGGRTRGTTASAAVGTTPSGNANASVPLQDLQVRAQLGNDTSSEIHTSVVHNCDDGSANFNYRLVWRPLHWPDPELVPRLRLHVWDVHSPSGFPLVGQLARSDPQLLATVTLDLSSIFEEAHRNNGRAQRFRQWIMMHRVGSGPVAASPRIQVSLDLLSKEQAMQHRAGSQVGQSGLPEPLQPVPFSAFAPQRYIRYRIARQWQDGFWYFVQAVLLVPGGIAVLKILAALPLLLYIAGAIVGIFLVLRMRRVEQELEAM